MKGYVSNIQKFSVNDGYGIRTIVFLLGCTLRCKWCQNPETLENKPVLMYVEDLCRGCSQCRGAEGCPYEASKMSGREMSAEEVAKEVLKDKVFYKNTGGGVTVSGGEPLMQIDFTAEILRRVKEESAGTCIETAGNVPWTSFEKVLPYTDLFLYDVKFRDTDLHREWIGCGNDLILSNLQRLSERGKEIIVRIPLIPEVNDGQEFRDMIDCVAEMKGIKEVHILPFHQLGSSKYDQLKMDYTMRGYREDNEEMVRECEQYAAEKGFRVSVGGSGF